MGLVHSILGNIIDLSVYIYTQCLLAFLYIPVKKS
jgi:hypothetical protein